MTMHNALHPKSDTDRLYLTRKEGGRGLISATDASYNSNCRIRKLCKRA